MGGQGKTQVAMEGKAEELQMRIMEMSGHLDRLNGMQNLASSFFFFFFWNQDRSDEAEEL